MLANNHHSLRKLNVLAGKRSKVQPITNNPHASVSIDDLALLVKKLSVQIDDLETRKEKPSEPQELQEPPLPPLPEQQEHHPTTSDTAKRPPTHTTVDPWASYVPQNYGALLQRLEDMASLQKCPSECCANTGTVCSADGVPWPNPIEPFQTAASSSSSLIGSRQQSLNDMLDTQYTHWCTIMRCLPLMDPVTCAHVKTVGLYAMREILKLKANEKRDNPPIQQTCCETTTKLRDSLSSLGGGDSNDVAPITTTTTTTATTATTITTANQDIPAWMSTSETKTAIADILVPTSEGTDTTTTPTPSKFSSPTLLKGKRFQKWVKHKKAQRKIHTTDDIASTRPIPQSHTLRKLGSWFF